jgi:hypothetical protein
MLTQSLSETHVRTGVTPTRAMRTVLIILLLSISASSCSVFKGDEFPLAADLAEVREQERLLVSETIVDANRSEAFFLLLARRDELLEEQLIVTRQHIERIEVLTKNYKSSRSDFDALFAEYNVARSVNQRGYIEIIGKMKITTTSQEWKVISKYQLKYLEARSLVYQSQVESE